VLQGWHVDCLMGSDRQSSGGNVTTRPGCDMSKMWKVVAALGLLFGMSGAASATAVAGFTCTTGSFLSVLTFSNDTSASGSGTFGEICITLVDSNTAFVQAEALAGFSMVGLNSLALNINGTDTCTGGTAGACVDSGGVTSNAAGPYTQDFPATDNVDGLGSFNFHISEANASSGATLLTFTIDTSGTPWTTVSDVLVNNLSGFDAAMHLSVLGSNCNGSPCTFFAGENTAGIIIGETPEPAVLSLLGIALLGMGFTVRRRNG
jgi:hypothetical protein